MSFKYLKLFKANEDTEEKNFLFEIEDKKYNFARENSISFETSDKIVKYFSKEGSNDIKYPYAYSKENIYFMLHRKYIPIEEYKR